MTNADFIKYKEIAEKIKTLLISEEHSSLYDIGVLYHILMEFPYCLDPEGHYVYKGDFYDSLNKLPIEALQQEEINIWYKKTTKVFIVITLLFLCSNYCLRSSSF